jgi:hypothetical protein
MRALGAAFRPIVRRPARAPFGCALRRVGERLSSSALEIARALIPS